MYRTRYGLGPRGIDWIETSVSGSQQNQQYPLYDGHGNMIATISLSGTLANLREYDPFDSLRSLRAGVWGGVRDQASVTTDPNARYCANLGHKQDDESGLIYMRARFYDSGTGRFISEDPARDGTNWFVYCNNDPIQGVDRTGRYPNNVLELWLFDIESLCAIGPEARIIFMAASVMWNAEVAAMGAAGFLSLRMFMFVADATAIAFGTPTIPGADVRTRAEAEARAYSISLLVTWWIFFDEIIAS